MSPLLWIIIGVGLLTGAGFLVYYMFFVEEEDEDDEHAPGYDGGKTMLEGAGADTLDQTMDATSAEFRGARKSQMLALKDSLERSLESRQGEGAEAQDRMSMPWFLLVGAGGSGKTTMLANTGLPLPYGPAFEVDSRKRDAGRWWLFEDAVVLEAPAASAAVAASDSTLAPGQTVASDTSHGWSTLLELLRRERPDSPLNGIVVTVSCSDLVAGARDSEKLVETAERIKSFLEKVRSVLGVRLPLHILVTKCDVLPGFRSFADNLPAGRRNDIFGWANPNKLETAFNPSWVDVGCDALKKELEDLRDEVLAAPDEIKDADGLFVFVSEFGNLQEPLRDFVSRLYPEGETRPSLFFRGMYFCGDTMDPELQGAVESELMASGKARATMQLSAEVALTGTTKSHNLVFLKSLFSEKIFKEAGLARPMARFRLSRDRRVVVAQAAAAVIAVVGGTGLWTTVNGVQSGDTVTQGGLKAEAEALAHALAGMAIDLDELKQTARSADSLDARRSRDAAVIELVEQMRSLHTLKRSPFIPASWMSPLPDQVKSSIEAGIQDIVLPVLRERLEEKVLALLDSASAEVNEGSVMENPRGLADYLNEVRNLSRRLTQYNRLAKEGTGSITDLASLLDYLFNVQMETSQSSTSEDFQIALRAASAPPIELSPRVAATVTGRAMRMVSTLGERAGQQLAKPRNAQAERAIQPEADLLALRQLAVLVELSDRRRGILAAVSDSNIVGSNPARLVQDSIVAQLRNAALAISGETGAADLQAERLRMVIDTVFSMRLMDPIEEGEIVADYGPHELLRWDVGRLELALSMRQEYERAIARVIETMPGQTPDRLRRAFEGQLRARVLSAAARGQRLSTVGPGTIPTVEVRLGAANLEAATGRLFRLAALLDTLKAGDAGKRLISAATRQAEQTIGTAQWILESDNALLPMPDRVAAWQGVIPLSWASVNASDSLAFETARLPLEGLVRQLAADVRPAIEFLSRVPPADVRVPRLAAEWAALASNMAKYDRGDLTASVFTMRRFLGADLNVRSMDACGNAASQADTTKPSPDPFIKRRRLFRAALVGRCGSGGADAVAAYGRLQSQFMTRLAGRYPFVDSTQALAPDVDPVLLKEFFAQYDAFMAYGNMALRSEPSIAPATRDARAFLDAMAPIRAFFAPLMDVADKKPVEYDVLVASDTATDRQLAVSGKEVPVDSVPHAVAWRYGDRFSVMRRDSTGRARLVYASNSSWSLLQMPKQASVRFFHPDSRVELTPPAIYPTAAPDIVGAKPAAPVAAPAGSTKAPAATKAGSTKVRPPVRTKARPTTKRP
jgi:type VI secretion system protein ImpL